MLGGKKEPVGRGKRKRRGIKNISVSTYRSSQKLLSWEAALNAQFSAQQLTLNWTVGVGGASPGWSSFSQELGSQHGRGGT